MGELSNNAWEKVGSEDFSLGQGVGEDRYNEETQNIDSLKSEL